MTKAIVALIIVLFTKNWRAYAAGETAGFDEATADALIEGGYAVKRSADAGASANKPKAVDALAKPPSAKGKKPAKVADANKPPALEPEVPEAEDIDQPEDDDETAPNADETPPLDTTEEKP